MRGEALSGTDQQPAVGVGWSSLRSSTCAASSCRAAEEWLAGRRCRARRLPRQRLDEVGEVGELRLAEGVEVLLGLPGEV